MSDLRKDELADRVVHNLSYHRPREQATQDAMENLRQASRDFADEVIGVVPFGRELSIAVTHIEDACMNAIAGLARNEDKFLAEIGAK